MSTRDLAPNQVCACVGHDRPSCSHSKGCVDANRESRREPSQGLIPVLIVASRQRLAQTRPWYVPRVERGSGPGCPGLERGGHHRCSYLSARVASNSAHRPTYFVRGVLSRPTAMSRPGVHPPMPSRGLEGLPPRGESCHDISGPPCTQPWASAAWALINHHASIVETTRKLFTRRGGYHTDISKIEWNRNGMRRRGTAASPPHAS